MVWSMESPLNALAKVQEIGANRQRSQLRGMEMGQQMEDQSRMQNMNALFRQTGGDPRAMESALTQAGDMQGVMQVRKMNPQANPKDELEMKLMQFDANARVMSGVKDEQSWQAAKPYLQEIWGADVAQHLPENYSPAMVEQNIRMGQSQKDQLAAQREERMMQHQDRMFDQGNRRLDILESRGDGGGKPVNWQTMQTADGFVQVHPVTGETRPVVVGGKQAQARPSAASMAAGSPQLRVRDAMDAIGIIEQAKTHLDTATASGLGTARDTAAGVFGLSTKGAQSAASLKALEGALVSKMPKMSGPQSDKDVLLYKQMAAQVGDSNIPIETRKAALATIEEMQRRYAGLEAAPQQQAIPSGLSPESASFFGQ